MSGYADQRNLRFVEKKPCTKCGGTGKENDHVAIGERLRKLREFRRVQAKTVAEILGISQSYLSDLEHGRRWWTMEKIQQYEKALK